MPVSKKDGTGITQTEFDDVVRQLEDRTLTGNAMKDVIQELCDRSKMEQWNDWYRRILIKDLRCGVTHKTINKHSDNKVPVFECMLADDSKKHEKKLVGECIVGSNANTLLRYDCIDADLTVDQKKRFWHPRIDKAWRAQSS